MRISLLWLNDGNYLECLVLGICDGLLYTCDWRSSCRWRLHRDDAQDLLSWIFGADVFWFQSHDFFGVCVWYCAVWSVWRNMGNLAVELCLYVRDEWILASNSNHCTPKVFTGTNYESHLLDSHVFHYTVLPLTRWNFPALLCYCSRDWDRHDFADVWLGLSLPTPIQEIILLLVRNWQNLSEKRRK